jgi:cyclopropane fatty-acyl-phospholipid synthase-like methyltransferase
MTNPDSRTLYNAVDQRQAGSLVSVITARLRAEHAIATGEGMVGVREVEEAATLLNVHQLSRIVDLGCGSAEPSRHVASNTDCAIVAVDVSLDRLRRIPPGAAVTAVHADLNAALPFTDQSFDGTVQFDSIVHVRDRDTYFTDLRRMMRPGSVLALTSSTSTELSTAEQARLGDVPGTIWRLSTNDLVNVLTRTGWQVDVVRSRRHEMIAWHRARQHALTEASEQLLEELNADGLERLVARASTVADLLEDARLDMVFVAAHC